MAEKKHKLKIIPLGGLGEIGKNITVIEYNNNIIVIDCGMAFPGDELLGIDIVIPDITYLVKNKEKIKGIMNSSGEGNWTVETALDLEVPTPVIALSLMMRYRSLEENTFSGRVVAALRNEFGGHKVEKA